MLRCPGSHIHGTVGDGRPYPDLVWEPEQKQAFRHGARFGKRSADIIKSQKTVVEGYYTINAAYNLAQKLRVDMPITEELYRIVYEDKDIPASLKDIIKREFKTED